MVLVMNWHRSLSRCRNLVMNCRNRVMNCETIDALSKTKHSVLVYFQISPHICVLCVPAAFRSLSLSLDVLCVPAVFLSLSLSLSPSLSSLSRCICVPDQSPELLYSQMSMQNCFSAMRCMCVAVASRCVELSSPVPCKLLCCGCKSLRELDWLTKHPVIEAPGDPPILYSA